MCGIAGVLHLDGSPVEAPLLERMGQSLRHRGPDAEGLLLDTAALPAVGFVHRRLSIIDLSPQANQPLGGEDGRVQVMLNGEIYNFAALRAELAPRHRFRSQGDTEAIAHGYEEQGDAVVQRLDGMFALALWDAGRRRLLLARDHFGKKQLYYWHDDRRLVLRSSFHQTLARAAAASPLSRLLYLNARTFLLDDLLPKMDRMTMAHGLEARSPLLDRALVEYVASLPDALKRRGARGKRVLKEVARPLLAAETLRRRKQGFMVPLGSWFRGELRSMVADALPGAPRLAGRLHAEPLQRLVREHDEGRADHGHRLWTLLTLELWMRRHRFS